MFQVSKIPKQPTRKVAPDVQVSNTSKCMACEAACCKCKKQGHHQSVCRSVTNLATIRMDTINEESVADVTAIFLSATDNTTNIRAFMNTELSNLPWKKVATDLFYWKAST